MLKKELKFIDIFSISAGAMISSGIFILPGLAFARTGPSVFLSYLLAGMLAATGVLSIAELSTAMPKAGGDYFYIARTLGPLAGTISGLLSWFALSLKSAFAIFGIVEILYISTGIPVYYSAHVITFLFVMLNIAGVDIASRFEVVIVMGLLGILLYFIGTGFPHVQVMRLSPFATQGINGIAATAGFVFISYGGLVNIASMAEEVRDPSRNIPLAMVSSLVIVIALYCAMLFVTVGVLDGDTLSGSMTPIADAARTFQGKTGFWLLSLAGMLAFVTTANAGIMSASRYPMALSRDNLLPAFIGSVSARFKTPLVSTIITGIFISATLFLNIDTLVKAASVVVITANILAHTSVLILRYSGIQNYRPSFRSPFFPFVQVVGIVLFLVLIVDLGYAAIEYSLLFVAAGLFIYLLYGRRHGGREYALLHLIELITDRNLTDYSLETELRDIIHSRDDITFDRFDKLVHQAPVLDIDDTLPLDVFFERAGKAFCVNLNMKCEELIDLLKKREEQSSTALTEFIAVPHIVIDGTGMFELFVVRCKGGVTFSPEKQGIKAIFILIGTPDERHFHLQVISAIAQITHNKKFEREWMEAKNENELRDIILLGKRHRLP